MKFLFLFNVLFAASVLNDIATRAGMIYHSAAQSLSGPLACFDKAYRSVKDKAVEMKDKLLGKLKKTNASIEETVADSELPEDFKIRMEEFQKRLMEMLENMQGDNEDGEGNDSDINMPIPVEEENDNDVPEDGNRNQVL